MFLAGCTTSRTLARSLRTYDHVPARWDGGGICECDWGVVAAAAGDAAGGSSPAEGGHADGDGGEVVEVLWIFEGA